jgi:hypothetical protein
MEKKRNMLTKVEDALNSLDGLQKASPGPFFFTRVQAGLRKEETGIWGRIGWFITKPAVAVASLSLVILLNAAVLLYQKQVPSGSGIADQNEPAYADDYNTTVATNSYYDENIESR